MEKNKQEIAIDLSADEDGDSVNSNVDDDIGDDGDVRPNIGE
jgi:hypothetical protein